MTLPIRDSNPTVERAVEEFKRAADREMAEALIRSGKKQLVTFRVFYRLPDRPDILQEFSHQIYDTAPRFPVLCKFVEWWNKNLDGKVHSVEVVGRTIIGGAKVRYVDALITH